MILHFRRIALLTGAYGMFVDERRCIEHPRLVHMQIRMADGEGAIGEDNEFRVGIAPGHTAVLFNIKGALDYLRAHPLSDDIVAIPPWEEVHGPGCDRAGA